MNKKVVITILAIGILLNVTGCSLGKKEEPTTEAPVVSQFSVNDADLYVDSASVTTETSTEFSEETPYCQFTENNSTEDAGFLFSKFNDQELYIMYSPDVAFANKLFELKDRYQIVPNCSLCQEREIYEKFSAAMQAKGNNDFNQISIDGQAIVTWNFELNTISSVSIYDSENTLVAENVTTIDQLPQ